MKLNPVFETVMTDMFSVHYNLGYSIWCVSSQFSVTHVTQMTINLYSVRIMHMGYEHQGFFTF